MTDREQDWEGLSSSLAAGSGGKYVPLSRAPGRYPAQRIQYLNSLPGPFSSIPIDGDHTAGVLTDYVGLMARRLGKDSVIVGVLKKGMSVLTEVLGRDPSLEELSILSHPDIELNSLVGRPAIVVDDSIHTGKTLEDISTRLKSQGVGPIIWTTLVAADTGVSRSSRFCSGILTVTTVTDLDFEAAFQNVVVPVLEVCKKGAIADRPYLDFTIPLPLEKSLDDGFSALISSLYRLRMARLLNGTLPMIGQPPVFHGALELTREFKQSVEAHLRSQIGDDTWVVMTKLRIFFAPANPTQVRIHGIVHPDSPVPVRELERAMDATSVWLLERVYEELSHDMKTRGYRVHRVATAKPRSGNST